MPEQMLKHIDETLGSLVQEVHDLREWVIGERRKRRIAISLLGAAILIGAVALAGLFVVTQEIDENRKLDQYENCVSTNHGREAIHRAMSILLDEISDAVGDQDGIQERIDRLHANLRRDLPIETCELG